MKTESSSEMPSKIVDVINCQNKSKWEFITELEIVKPIHYFLGKDVYGKCVYCELEVMKEREAKLKAQLEKAVSALRAVNKVGLTHYEDCPTNIEDCEVCTCGIESIMNQVWNAIEEVGK